MVAHERPICYNQRLMHASGIACALLVAAGTQAPTGGSDHRLLPTAALEGQISALAMTVQSLKDSHDPLVVGVKAQLASVKRAVRGFIIRQIEAYPSISKCELQKQLADAFDKDDGACGVNGMADSMVPQVFVQPWIPKSTRRVFLISLGFYRVAGSETVSERYVWERERGVHRVVTGPRCQRATKVYASPDGALQAVVVTEATCESWVDFQATSTKRIPPCQH